MSDEELKALEDKSFDELHDAYVEQAMAMREAYRSGMGSMVVSCLDAIDAITAIIRKRFA